MRKLLLAAVASAAVVATLAAAAPALAQSVEELTVTGEWNGRGEPPARLSRVVGFGDLDLRNGADQAILRDRVTRVAAEICDELGQDRPNRTNLGRSCEEMAVENAQQQVRFAVAQAYHQPPAYVATGQGADTAYVARVGPTADNGSRSASYPAEPPAATQRRPAMGPPPPPMARSSTPRPTAPATGDRCPTPASTRPPQATRATRPRCGRG